MLYSRGDISHMCYIAGMLYLTCATHCSSLATLSNMLHIVGNEMFTFEIDTENTLLNCTWNAEDTTLKTPRLQRSNLVQSSG